MRAHRFILLLLSVLGSFINSPAQKPNRIVSAGSAITETICALGVGEQIVGSDRTILYPAFIQSLPSIGYRSGISAEGIISLQPTLVVAEKNYVDDKVIDQVRSTGIRILVIERTYTFEGTSKMIEQIAHAIKRQKEGEQLISSIERQLMAAATLLKKAKQTPRVLGIYNRGTTSFDAAGTKTFSDILPYAGAVNVITGVDGYKPLNAEAMIAADPDYLLFFESGLKSIGGISGVLEVAGVNQTTAGRQKQIVSMDGIKLSNFGPRLGEAVTELITLLHPDLK